MKNELTDLISDAEVCLQDAYRRGYEDGNATNKALLDEKKDMLKKFESYLSKFRKLESEDNETIYIKKSATTWSGILLDTLIRNFLLSYTDE